MSEVLVVCRLVSLVGWALVADDPIAAELARGAQIWVESYDPWAHGGLGELVGTSDIARAKRWTPGEFQAVWCEATAFGRPIRAFTVELTRVER